MNSYKLAKYLTGFSFLTLGRYPVSWLLSCNKKKKLQKTSSQEYFYIKSTTGNIIYIEFHGLSAAQPLILLHGLNSSSAQWHYQTAYFEKNYRVILVDLPGHGKSLKPHNLSTSALAEDLKFIIDYFKIEKPIVWGHSLGGILTMEYCRKYAGNLNLKAFILQHNTYTNPFKTCLFSSVLYAIQKPVLIPFLKFSKKYSSIIYILCYLNYLNGFSSLFFRFIFFTGKQSAQELRFMAKISLKCSPAVVAEGILELLKFNITSQLKEIKSPALIIGAEKDRITKLNAASFIHSQIENSQFKILKEGHLSLVENPSEVNKTIAAFVKEYA